jgi:hypothetical protein
MCAPAKSIFACGGIFRKIVLLQTLIETWKKCSEKERNLANSASLFVIVGSDFIDGTWAGRAELPSIFHSDRIMDLRFLINIAYI